MNDDIPDDIMEAVAMINKLRSRKYLSRNERETMNRAKLRIAYWACRNEDVAATRDTLSYILGSDAVDILNAYDKYMERGSREGRPKAGKKPGNKGKGKDFWKGA